MEIRRITLKEYFSLTDKSSYNFVISNSKEFNEPINHLNFKNFDELSFGFIKDYQTDLENEELNFLKQLEYLYQLKDEKEIEKYYLDEVCQSLAFMLLSITELLKNENILLSSSQSIEEEMADSSPFQVFGVMPQFYELCNNDLTKLKEVRQLQYNDCITYLLYKKETREYEKRLNKIYENKTKN